MPVSLVLSLAFLLLAATPAHAEPPSDLSPPSVLSAGLRPTIAPGGPAELVGPFRLASNQGSSAYAGRLDGLANEISADRIMLSLCRHGFVGCPDAARRFEAIVAAAGQREGRARLGELNRSINLAIAYTSDESQHGRADVWSAPLATFATMMGDCEDYAIAKYVALLELSVPAADLRIVILRPRPGGGGHAVLAARLDGQWLLLDNRTLLLVSDTERAGAIAALRLEEPHTPHSDAT